MVSCLFSGYREGAVSELKAVSLMGVSAPQGVNKGK